MHDFQRCPDCRASSAGDAHKTVRAAGHRLNNMLDPDDRESDLFQSAHKCNDILNLRSSQPRGDFIEQQEDIWFDCLDRLKWDTFDIVCLKKYLEDRK